MWCSPLDLKMNAQPFRLPPAIYGKCRLKFLQVGVWTHGWLRVNADDLKSKQRDGLTRSHIGTLACERKRKHKRVLDKESAEVKRKVAIATSAPRMSTQVCLRQKKTPALFESTSQWCVNDLIYVLLFFHVMSPQEQKMRLPMMCCICAVWKKVDIRSRKRCWITGEPMCVGVKALWGGTSGPALLPKRTQTLLNPGWQRLVNFFSFFKLFSGF